MTGPSLYVQELRDVTAPTTSPPPLGETPEDIIYKHNRSFASTVFGMPAPWNPFEVPLCVLGLWSR
jgi:hypothetical protein